MSVRFSRSLDEYTYNELEELGPAEVYKLVEEEVLRRVRQHAETICAAALHVFVCEIARLRFPDLVANNQWFQQRPGYPTPEETVQGLESFVRMIDTDSSESEEE